MPEKLVLQWNDFKDNVKTAFGNLRDDKNFTDVTLASGDGQQVEAHKVILAASSPFFQKLLESNRHPHPLICMRGMKFNDLLAIVDFLYFGQTSVFQENLNFFFSITQELELKGLVGNGEENFEDLSNTELSDSNEPKAETHMNNTPENFHNRQETSILEAENKVAPRNSFSGEEDLEERVKSLMEKSTKIVTESGFRVSYKCKVCGKEDASCHMKNHIEAKHLDDIVLSCDHCDNVFRTRNSLKCHKLKFHNPETIPPMNKVQQNTQEISKHKEDNIKDLSNLSQVFEDLDNAIRPMMEKTNKKLAHLKGKRVFKCKVCGKESRAYQIKNHIEAKHLGRVIIPCDHCDKIFRTRSALYYHKLSLRSLMNAA